jgi:hypothetical protein
MPSTLDSKGTSSIKVDATGSARSLIAQPDSDIKQTAAVNSLKQNINITYKSTKLT